MAELLCAVRRLDGEFFYEAVSTVMLVLRILGRTFIEFWKSFLLERTGLVAESVALPP